MEVVVNCFADIYTNYSYQMVNGKEVGAVDLFTITVTTCYVVGGGDAHNNMQHYMVAYRVVKINA